MLNTTVTPSNTAIIINIFSLIGALLTGTICISILIILFPAIIKSRHVVLVLTANNYLALLSFSFGATMANIDMLKGDFQWFIGEETMNCRLKSYILYALLAVIFNAFGLQAMFRFSRVVCSAHIWLQYRRTYAIVIPFTWILSFILLLPIHIWHDIEFIPTENFCFIGTNKVRGFIWSAIAIYGLPMNMIIIIYMKVMQSMRRSTILVSTRTKRDVIVVRRIVLVVIVLMLIGAPTVILELMLPFTDVGKPLFYRISNITMIIAMIVLSFLLIYVTPPVKGILLRWSKNHSLTPPNTL